MKIQKPVHIIAPPVSTKILLILNNIEKCRVIHRFPNSKESDTKNDGTNLCGMMMIGKAEDEKRSLSFQ